jgi:hypothetical protein
MSGLVVGLIRFGLEVGYGSPACFEHDTRPWILKDVYKPTVNYYFMQTNQ